MKELPRDVFQRRRHEKPVSRLHPPMTAELSQAFWRRANWADFLPLELDHSPTVLAWFVCPDAFAGKSYIVQRNDERPGARACLDEVWLANRVTVEPDSGDVLVQQQVQRRRTGTISLN